jgi:hypothetical protein
VKLREIIRRGPRAPDYLVPDEEGKLVPYVPTSERASRAVVEYRQALAEAEQGSTFAYESLDGEKMACPEHGWSGESGKPRPPKGACPYCQEGRGHVQATDRRIDPAERSPEEAASIDRPLRVMPGQERDARSAAMIEGHAKWKDAQVAAGHVLPNTPAEREAIERSDELRRRETRQRDRVPAGHKIEGGEIVPWFHSPRRKRPRRRVDGERPFREQGSEVYVDA